MIYIEYYYVCTRPIYPNLPKCRYNADSECGCIGQCVKVKSEGVDWKELIQEIWKTKYAITK